MLTPRIRLLSTISSFYTIRERERAFRFVERALRKKVYPTRFFTEIFIHLSLFLGYPAMLDGLERLSVITGTTVSSRRTSRGQKGVAKKGERILRRIYGSQSAKLISRLDRLEKGLGTRITKDAYGAVMARPGLSLGDREIINVIVLFIDGYEPQLYSHLRGALRVGVKIATLKTVLFLAARIAAKDPSPAIDLLHRISQNPNQRSF